MIQNKINIAGKEAYIAYCYATEIAYQKYTGKNIDSFEGQNPEDVIYLILASIVSYYKGKQEEPPFKAEDLMYNATPKELIAAVTEVFNLRAEWYEVPTGDKIEDNTPEGESEKNG